MARIIRTCIYVKSEGTSGDSGLQLLSYAIRNPRMKGGAKISFHEILLIIVPKIKVQGGVDNHF